jgi:hypothetical protein
MPKLRSERVSARRALPRGQAMITDDDDSGSASAPGAAGPAEEGGEGVSESVISSEELSLASSAAAAADGEDGGAAAVLDFPALSAKELAVSPAACVVLMTARASCLCRRTWLRWWCRLALTPLRPVDHVRVSVGIGHRELPALVCALARRRALVVESFFSLRVLRSSSCALIRLCASANVMAACFYARNTKLTTLLPS